MTEQNSFGFIITRHISSDEHQNYWRECVRCIRNFYVNEQIIIIDDNSSIKNDIDNEMKEFTNIKIVISEYHGAGEILGYYYGWKYRPFNKFIVMHDSMFLQQKIPCINQNLVFLWHFDKYLGQSVDGCNNDNNVTFINYCGNKENLFKLYYDKSSWLGCFGVSSIITLEILDIIFTKYNFLNCIKNVKIRHDREAMERVFALIAFLEEPLLKTKVSIMGNILTDYPYSFNLKYVNYVNGYRNSLPIIKVWSGR